MESNLTSLIRNHVGRILSGGVLASALVACASSNPTPHLVDARAAYEEAEDSAAARTNPRGLERARIALDRAEQAHDEDPGSPREQRLAERAEDRAEALMARAEAREAARGERREQAREERAMEARAEQPQPIEADDVDRDDRPMTRAEKREATAALQNLGPVADVKQEPRGVVITLSGSLLFPTGKEEMSPVARQNLDQVAHALAQQSEDTTFQIEGHTDDSGSDAQNEQLSTERANAVAEHLIRSGIDRDRVRVVGRGESHPIAGNDTPEGRATNRRVEIVVEGRS